MLKSIYKIPALCAGLVIKRTRLCRSLLARPVFKCGNLTKISPALPIKQTLSLNAQGLLINTSDNLGYQLRN